MQLATSPYYVREAQVTDLNYVIDMDTKHTDDPWLPEDWIDRMKYRGTFVATNFGEPVGFIHLRQSGAYTGVITKLVVKPDHRRSGIGSRLLLHGCVYLGQAGLGRAQIVVPDRRLDPHDPSDVSSFLTAAGFKPVEFVRGRFPDLDSDGVIFERSL